MSRFSHQCSQGHHDRLLSCQALYRDESDEGDEGDEGD